MKKYKILIVEDDEKIASVLKDYLEPENFKVAILHRGDEVIPSFRASPPDAILLDILLPGDNGLSVFKKIRSISNVPILFMTAKAEDTDRLLGLEMGADDYICKPFSLREVVARVKAVLRRTYTDQVRNFLTSGPITLDTSNRLVTIFGSEMRLTPIEFDLLKLFISRPGQVFTRNDLMSSVQRCHLESFERTIDSHLCNLRKKIAVHLPGKKLIHTIYSIGYSYSPDTESQP